MRDAIPSGLCARAEHEERHMQWVKAERHSVGFFFHVQLSAGRQLRG